MDIKTIFAFFFFYATFTLSSHNDCDNAPLPSICKALICSRYNDEEVRKVITRLTPAPGIINEKHNNYPILLHAVYWQCWAALDTLFELHSNPRSLIKLDLNKRDRCKNTIVHALVHCKAPRVLVNKALTLKPSLVNTPNEDDETPMEFCLKHNDEADLIAVLAVQGAIIRKKTVEYAVTYKRFESLTIINAVLRNRELENRRQDPTCEEFWETQRLQSSASDPDDDILFRGDFDESPETMV